MLAHSVNAPMLDVVGDGVARRQAGRQGVVSTWRRIGVVDMAVDLDESGGKSRENLPGGSFPALSRVK